MVITTGLGLLEQRVSAAERSLAWPRFFLPLIAPSKAVGLFLVDIACSALSGIAPRHRESVMGGKRAKLENVDRINEPVCPHHGLVEPTAQPAGVVHARGGLI